MEEYRGGNGFPAGRAARRCYIVHICLSVTDSKPSKPLSPRRQPACAGRVFGPQFRMGRCPTCNLRGIVRKYPSRVCSCNLVAFGTHPNLILTGRPWRTPCRPPGRSAVIPCGSERGSWAIASNILPLRVHGANHIRRPAMSRITLFESKPIPPVQLPSHALSSHRFL